MTRDLDGLTGPRNLGDAGRDLSGMTGRSEPAPTPDPLADVDYTGNLATDAAAELTALEEGYRTRAKAEADRFRAATDSEYWVAVCFTSREDKEAFLRAANLTDIGDKYLSGPAVAARLGIHY